MFVAYLIESTVYSIDLHKIMIIKIIYIYIFKESKISTW